MLLMIDSIVRMLLYNLYGVFSVLCQICSILPLCIVFIVTSKLKCFICNRSNICYAGSQGQCPILRLFSTIIFFYIVFYAIGALDSFFSVLGYVKENQKRYEKMEEMKEMIDVNDKETYISTTNIYEINISELNFTQQYDKNISNWDYIKRITTNVCSNCSLHVQSNSTSNVLKFDDNDSSVDNDDDDDFSFDDTGIRNDK